MSGCGDPIEISLERRAGLVRDADELLLELYPICRSITGDGVRQSLAILRKIADFDIREVPSGTVCYDWVVPDEWNLRDAYIADAEGNRIVDFRNHNLHVVSYSVPVDQLVSFGELREHLFTLPALPEAIPYRTSYYGRSWGFCISHRQLLGMDPDASYRVYIDSTLEPGSMTFGEAQVGGGSSREFLVSTYCCHPSLANDGLSGMVLWALLLRELRSARLRHSYRFVIAPETIGVMAYLSRNEPAMKTVRGGFVITTVAGPGSFGYKETFLRDHLIDRVVRQTLRELGLDFRQYPFDVMGSDEANYSSPFFRIPVGTICKDKYYEYDYYHTSLDNLDFVSATDLVRTLELYLGAIEKLETDAMYRSLNPQGMPMLSKRGLYPTLAGDVKQRAGGVGEEHARRLYETTRGRVSGDELDGILWVMFYADGATSLLDMAERTNVPMRRLAAAAELLRQHGLVERVADSNAGER